MTIQRATVFGSISGVVATRTVFTADITIVAGDEPENYWGPYLESFYNPIENYISTIWSSSHVEVTIPEAGHWSPIDTFTFEHVGEETGQALANAVAGVIIGKAPGLRHFGRKFISPFTEAVVTGNLMDAVLVIAMAQAALAYVSPLTTILGSVLEPGVVDAAGAFHPFVGSTVSSILGSIRKRKPGVGI